jgi:Ca2+-binding EF-hand superfamily protein
VHKKTKQVFFYVEKKEMGGILSYLQFGTEEDYKVRKAIERELSLIAQHTSWEVEELRELHAAFLSQYPTGFISPQQFVDENTEAIGGPPELWQHYFNLIATPPLIRRRQRHTTTSVLGMSINANAAALKEKNSSRTTSGTRGGAPGVGNNTTNVRSATAGTGVNTNSISDRLAAANNRGAGASADEKIGLRMKTSLVSTSNPTEELDLDPHVVGLTFSHCMLRLHRSLFNASEQKLKYLFNFFDVNQDGLISEHDLETAFGWLFQVPLVHQTQAYQDLEEDQRNAKVRAETLMRIWDRDGDGLLNQDEFVEMGRADPDLLELLSALRK